MVGRRHFGWVAGLVASCLLFARQDLLFWSVVGGDDIAFAVFCTAALSFFMLATQEGKLSRFALAGIFAGLGWLDKASGVALLAAFAIGLFASRQARSSISWRSVLAVTAPSLLVFGLYVFRNYEVYGRPGSPYTAVEWLGRDHFPAYFALYEPVPSVRDIVSRIGIAGVGRSIKAQLSLLGRLTLRDASLLALIPAAFVLRRRNGPFSVFSLAFVASLVFITCVVHHVEYRYLSPLIVLGAVSIGGVVEELAQWIRSRFARQSVALRAAASCLLIAFVSFACVRRYRDMGEMGASMKIQDECAEASYFISQVIPKDEAILTMNAWYVSWKTERAAVEAPTNGDEALLIVARHYDIRWAMTGKPVPGAVDLERALWWSPRVTSVLRPQRVYWGRACNVYRLNPTYK
jgi:hypothetical protein